MTIRLSRSERRHGWWIERRATVPCAVAGDGLLVKFNLADVEPLLDANYQRRGDFWYFNDSLDRECAEIWGDEVTANPQILLRHFL